MTPGSESCNCIGGFSESGDKATLLCTICPAGYFAKAGSRECSKCAAGSFSSQGSSSCTLCSTGHYSLEGAPLCLECGPGYIASDEGQDECDPCPLGAFSPSSTGDSCELCPLGEYADFEGMATCTPCAPGEITPDFGAIGVEMCVNPTPNFTIGLMTLGFVLFAIYVYLLQGRLQKIAFERKVLFVEPLAKVCHKINARLLEEMQIKIKVENTIPSFVRVFLFLTFSSCFLLISSIMFYLFVFYKAFYKAMFLWRGFDSIIKVPSFIGSISSALGDVARAMGLPMSSLTYLFYPIVFLYRVSMLFSLDLSTIDVKCLGAKAPAELVINFFIVGIVVSFMLSGYQYLWVIVFPSLNQTFLNLNFSKKEGLLSNQNVYLCLMGMALISINPFEGIMRYLMTFMTLADFVKDNGAHAITPACDNIEGMKNFDSLLGYSSSVIAWWLLMPFIYIMSEVLVPKTILPPGAPPLDALPAVDMNNMHGVLPDPFDPQPLDNNLPAKGIKRGVVQLQLHDVQNIEKAHKKASFLEILRRYKKWLGQWISTLISIDIMIILTANTWLQFVSKQHGVHNVHELDVDTSDEDKSESSSDSDSSKDSDVDSDNDSNIGKTHKSAKDNSLEQSDRESEIVLSSDDEIDDQPNAITEVIPQNAEVAAGGDEYDLSSDSDGDDAALRIESDLQQGYMPSEAIPSDHDDDSFILSDSSNDDHPLNTPTIPQRTVSANTAKEESVMDKKQEKISTVEKKKMSKKKRDLIKAKKKIFDWTSFWNRLRLEKHNLRFERDKRRLLKAKAKEADSKYNRFSTYNELCVLVGKELRQKGVPIFFSIAIAWLGVGHPFTVVGKRHWRIVGRKYYIFMCACFGIWTDETVASYGLEEIATTIFVDDDNEANYTKLLYICIGIRAILFQLLQSLTFFSVIVSSLAGSPLFVFSENLRKNLPSLLVVNSWHRAIEQEIHVHGNNNVRETRWVLYLRCVIITLGESRSLSFVSNFLTVCLSFLVLIYSEATKGLMAFVLCCLFPFALAKAFIFVIFFGKSMDLTDRDFIMFFRRLGYFLTFGLYFKHIHAITPVDVDVGVDDDIEDGSHRQHSSKIVAPLSPLNTHDSESEASSKSFVSLQLDVAIPLTERKEVEEKEEVDDDYPEYDADDSESESDVDSDHSSHSDRDDHGASLYNSRLGKLNDRSNSDSGSHSGSDDDSDEYDSDKKLSTQKSRSTDENHQSSSEDNRSYSLLPVDNESLAGTDEHDSESNEDTGNEDNDGDDGSVTSFESLPISRPISQQQPQMEQNDSTTVPLVVEAIPDEAESSSSEEEEINVIVVVEEQITIIDEDGNIVTDDGMDNENYEYEVIEVEIPDEEELIENALRRYEDQSIQSESVEQEIQLVDVYAEPVIKSQFESLLNNPMIERDQTMIRDVEVMSDVTDGTNDDQEQSEYGEVQVEQDSLEDEPNNVDDEQQPAEIITVIDEDGNIIEDADLNDDNYEYEVIEVVEDSSHDENDDDNDVEAVHNDDDAVEAFAEYPDYVSSIVPHEHSRSLELRESVLREISSQYVQRPNAARGWIDHALDSHHITSQTRNLTVDRDDSIPDEDEDDNELSQGNTNDIFDGLIDVEDD